MSFAVRPNARALTGDRDCAKDGVCSRQHANDMTNSLHDELRKAIRMKGRVAYRSQVALKDNPFIEHSEASQDWEAGWLEAASETAQDPQ